MSRKKQPKSVLVQQSSGLLVTTAAAVTAQCPHRERTPAADKCCPPPTPARVRLFLYIHIVRCSQVHPEVMLTDTVGFIQKLPTNLVAAFRATLEEVRHDTSWRLECTAVVVGNG